MKHDPAFPLEMVYTQENEKFNGMTLRDYFAAKVLVNSYKEYAANVHANKKGVWDTGWRVLVAKDAYELADAMMKARQE